MPSSVKAKLQVIQTRKMIAMSALSDCSDVSEFLAQKVEELSQGVEYYNGYSEGLNKALSSSQIDHDVFDQETSSALKDRTDELRGLVVVKRQRKFIEEDRYARRGRGAGQT